jgi:hypothetical protein
MPDWSLQTARRTARSLGVWLAWAVLTGRLTHDRTYGELRRLDATDVAKQLVFMTLTLGVLGWFVTAIPPAAVAWLGPGLLLGAGFGLVVAGSSLLVTWYADYSLGR